MHPYLFWLGSYHVPTYGPLLVAGGALAIWLLSGFRARMGLKSDEEFWLLINVILFSMFFGAHIMFAIEYTRPFSREFWRSAAGLTDGRAFLGSVILTLVSLIVFCRRFKVPVLRLLDYAFLGAPIQHGFGRLGCFMAGCCYGKPTTLPWAVTFTDPTSSVDLPFLGKPLHPTQLYEVGGEVVIFLVLYYWILPKVEAGRLPQGAVAAAYLILYSVLRFIGEFYRGDSVPFGLGLTAAQAVCVATVAAAGALLAYGRKGKIV